MIFEEGTIAITLDGETAANGDTISGRATVAECDEKARGVRFELVYRNEYREEETEYYTDSDGDSQTRTKTETKHEDFVVDGREKLGRGPELHGEHAFELTVPDDAPPSAGELVEWKVRVVIDREKANDAEEEVPITVQSSPALNAAREQGLPHKDEGMHIEVDPRRARPGDTIQGRLVFEPEKKVKLTDLRVELIMEREDFQADSSEDASVGVQVSGKTEIEGGTRQEHPFELIVPELTYPCFATRHNAIRWYCQATAARRLRSDFNAKLELNLYTAPAE